MEDFSLNLYEWHYNAPKIYLRRSYSNCLNPHFKELGDLKWKDEDECQWHITVCTQEIFKYFTSGIIFKKDNIGKWQETTLQLAYNFSD